MLGFCCPPGDARPRLQLRGGEQSWLVPVTMVPFRREEVAFVKGERGVQGVLTYSGQVSQALQELLVLWAAARGQETTFQLPNGCISLLPQVGA